MRRNPVKKYALAIIFVLTTFVAHAQEVDWKEFMADTPASHFASYTAQQDQTDSPTINYAVTKKSPKKALFYSAAVPGMGQAYAGSYLKTAVFVAIETAAWVMYAVKHKDGEEIEDQFQEYANTNWSEEDYFDWIHHWANKETNIARSDIEGLRAWETSNFSHHLHQEKDQQYYEMIGKYDQFNYGWNDFDKSGNSIDNDVREMKELRTENRLYYEDLQFESNKAFKRATTGMTIVMFNHILSAIDAAWTVSRHNKEIASASLNVKPLLLDNQQYAVLNFRVDW